MSFQLFQLLKKTKHRVELMQLIPTLAFMQCSEETCTLSPLHQLNTVSSFCLKHLTNLHCLNTKLNSREREYRDPAHGSQCPPQHWSGRGRMRRGELTPRELETRPQDHKAGLLGSSRTHTVVLIQPILKNIYCDLYCD